MRRRKAIAPLRESVLDKAIAGISPAWGLKRAKNKVSLGALRAFEAAEEARDRTIRKSKGSADSVGIRSIEIMRQRARDLDENYNIASGALDTLEAKVVGSEILAHPMVMLEGGNELAQELNAFLSEQYRRFAERPEVTREHSMGEIQRLSARSLYRDGECFLHHLQGRIAGLRHSTDVPYSIDVLEADYCPVRTQSLMRGRKNFRHGIEQNAWGQAVRYLMYQQHPGDSLFAFRRSALIEQLKWVDAGRISHIKYTKRLRQTRGVSIFASVFNSLSDLKDYEDSERLAARIGSYVALAIHKSVDADTSGETDSSPRELDWERGMIWDGLLEGDKIESIKNERPSNQIKPFREQMLKAAAAGTRTGYSSIAKDYTGTYSAQRQELVESEMHYALLTESFVSMMIRPVYRNFVDMAFIAGIIPHELLRDIDLNTLYNAAYRGPSVAYIDPVKEINHELLGVQAGFWSKQHVQLRRGMNPAEVAAEIEQERKIEDEKNIVTISNPGSKNKLTGTSLKKDKEAGDQNEEGDETEKENES